MFIKKLNQPTENNMETNKMLELCLRVAKAKKKKESTLLAQEIRRAFGITEAEVRNFPLPERYLGNEDDTAAFAYQIVQVALMRLRGELVKLALQKKVVKIGKPLPQIGFWSNMDYVLADIGSTNKFTLASGSHTDPLSNTNFIEFLMV